MPAGSDGTTFADATVRSRVSVVWRAYRFARAPAPIVAQELVQLLPRRPSCPETSCHAPARSLPRGDTSPFH